MICGMGTLKQPYSISKMEKKKKKAGIPYFETTITKIYKNTSNNMYQ